MNKLARVVVEEPNSDSVQDRDAGNVEQYLKKKIEAEIRIKLGQFAREILHARKKREERWPIDSLRDIH